MPYIDVFYPEEPPSSRICNPVPIDSDTKLETVYQMLITPEEYELADKKVVKAWDKLAKKFAKANGDPKHVFGRKIHEPIEEEPESKVKL
jgi:hypothetical protein